MLLLNAQMGGDTACLNNLFWSTRAHLGTVPPGAKSDPAVFFVNRELGKPKSTGLVDAPEENDSKPLIVKIERVFEQPFAESTRTRDGPLS